MKGLRARARARRRRGALAVLVLVVALHALSASYVVQAQVPAGMFSIAGKEDEPITVDADSLAYDRDADTLRAKGDVMVTVGGSVLAADQIDIDRKTGQAEASGSVVVEDPQGRIRADNATFLLEDETGFLEEGEIYLPQSRFQITGARLEKGIGQSYRIWDGTMTTCQCEEGAPDWSIEGEEIDVSLGGFGTLRNGVFKVKDQQILYLPYGLFPMLRDRQSGFLFPRFGYSNNRGFQYEQPFYWAINKSSDATIALDIETAARIGLLTEYRYALAADAGGEMSVTYFNERIRGTTADEVVDAQMLADPDVPENRGSIIGYHQQPGPGGSKVYFRPFLVSDSLFLREMNVLTNVPYENLISTTRRYTTSRAGIAKVWDWGLAKGEATWYQDLIQKQSRVPQPLPRLTFQARDSLFNSRLLLRLNTEAVEYYRAPLASGPRLDFAPEVQAPFRIGPYAYGNMKVILRETAYYLFNDDIPVPPAVTQPDGQTTFNTRDVDRFQNREIVQFSSNISSELARVFEVEDWGSIKKLKHTIEPFLRYDYVPLVDQTDLPLYDAIDRINSRNLITYGLATRLLAKTSSGVGKSLLTEGVPAGETYGNELIGDQPYGPPLAPKISGDSLQALTDERIQELGRAWIQQSYEISRPFFPGQNFSGIDTGLSLTPLGFFGARGRMIYAVEDPHLLYATVGVNLFDPRPIAGPDDLFLTELRPVNSLSIFYQFTSNSASGTTTTNTPTPQPTPPSSIENLNIATTYRVTNNIGLSYLGRYDAAANKFLENWAGIRLISSCDCWVVDLALVDRANPNELEVRVLVSLVGLGSFGQQPFNRGYGAMPRQFDPTAVGRSY